MSPKTGAKRAKSEQMQKTEFALSDGWQRDLVEFSAR
jgi:hypothetical protein